jgi:Domain of unknown function (DUF4377)
MRKGILILALLGCTGFAGFPEAGLARAQQLTFSRPTFVGIHYDRQPPWHYKLYEDGEYMFVFRNHDGGEYVPGIFVQNVRKNMWMEIRRISTENAVLGRSPGPDDLIKCPIPETWDFSTLRKREYADLPLKTSRLLFVPDRIARDEERKVYRIEFTPPCELAYLITRFFIRIEELNNAFENPQPTKKEITIQVDHYRPPCDDERGPRLCYLVSKDNPYEFPYFYYEIEGFDFQWGNMHRLIVVEEEVPQYTAVEPRIVYRLVKILSKKPVPPARNRFYFQLKNPYRRNFTVDQSSNVILTGGVTIKFINPKLKEKFLKASETAESINCDFKSDFKQHNVIILTEMRVY